MKRSSVGAGQPLRVRNNSMGDSQGKPRSSMSGDKRSSSGSRLSGSRTSFGAARGGPAGYGKSRPSTSMPQQANKRRTTVGRYDVRQDPRPITDRKFKEHEIALLVEFLVERGYPHQMSHKQLHSPLSKDFCQIFEFMYSLLEPGYRCQGKIEEQFPSVMKDLGYPYTISKTSMYSIGSPHTWPNMLAALSWLREWIQYSLGLDVDKLLFPTDHFDSVPSSKILANYVENTYRLFLEGEDTFEEADSRLARDISKNSAGGDIESLVHENRRLKAELENLEKQSDPMIVKQDELASRKLDYTKMIQYQDQLENCQKQLKLSLKTLEEEFKTKEAELGVLQVEKTQKEQILSTQVFSPDDVERINMQRQSLLQQIEATEAENDSIQEMIWEEERKIAKGQDKIQKKCTEYNQQARMLRLIPASEPEAQGIDFELQYSLNESHNHHITHTIKPALNQILIAEIDKLNDLEEQKIRTQQVHDKTADQISDKKESCADLEKELVDCDDKLDRKKKLQAEELSAIQEKIRVSEEKLKELHTPSPNIQSLEQECKDLTARLEKLDSDDDAERKKMLKFMKEAACKVVDHKTAIQDHTRKIRDEAKERLDAERKKDSMK